MIGACVNEARKPYEFGCKVSITTPATAPKGGQFEDHRLGRNYLKGREGDRINAILAAIGYNFGLLMRWFDGTLRVLLLLLRCTPWMPRFA